MGLFRRLVFVIGIVLIALPILPFFTSLNLIPKEPNIGLVNNDTLSFVIGIVLLILVYMSWKRERKIMFGGRFLGPRGPGDAQLMPGMAKILEERRRREQEALKRGYVMQMKAIDKRYSSY